jgi:putative transposase
VISKYEFIDGEKANYPVTKMCLWAGVSKSGYYDWRKRPLSATAERREELAVDVRKVFDASDGTYGHRRVHAELGRKKIAAGLELVRRVMVEGDMVACQPRPYRRTTDPDGTPSTADLVDRDFTAAEPGVKLVGDITYIRTWEGWVYLATVLDCFSKMVRWGPWPCGPVWRRSRTSSPRQSCFRRRSLFAPLGDQRRIHQRRLPAGRSPQQHPARRSASPDRSPRECPACIVPGTNVSHVAPHGSHRS